MCSLTSVDRVRVEKQTSADQAKSRAAKSSACRSSRAALCLQSMGPSLQAVALLQLFCSQSEVERRLQLLAEAVLAGDNLFRRTTAVKPH